MNWDAIGATAELLASVGVFVTFIYLSVQIRQNTVALELSRLRAVLSDAQLARGRFVENKEIAELYIAGLTKPDSLDTADRLRFRMMLDQLFFDWQEQTAELGMSSAADHFIGKTLSTPGGRSYWEKAPHHIFRPEFVAHIDGILDRITVN